MKPARIAEMIRVDHAGEYGAIAIYRGQLSIFERRRKHAKIAIQTRHMAEEEQSHLDAFDELIRSRRVRPTLLSPLWNLAGFGLGVATALLGEKTAHLCTEAVESVIENHYDAQTRELEQAGEHELAELFAKFRDEEAEHRSIAQQGGANSAPLAGPLSALMRLACRTAIAVSEKV